MGSVSPNRSHNIVHPYVFTLFFTFESTIDIIITFPAMTIWSRKNTEHCENWHMVWSEHHIHIYRTFPSHGDSLPPVHHSERNELELRALECFRCHGYSKHGAVLWTGRPPHSALVWQTGPGARWRQLSIHRAQHSVSQMCASTFSLQEWHGVRRDRR